MKVGSLFSGIGGFDLGLERAGFEIIWQVEIDPFCNKVLAKHWPNVKRFLDVKTVGSKELEPVDLVCGGFPCQPYSCAGKRMGAEDDRALWPEMLRIIQEVRPRWVIGENVAGFVNMGLDNSISDLEREGYAVQAFIIPACAVNAPHRRDRVWIVACNVKNSISGRNRGRCDGSAARCECSLQTEGPDCHATDTTNPGIKNVRERENSVFQNADVTNSQSRQDNQRNGRSLDAPERSGECSDSAVSVGDKYVADTEKSKCELSGNSRSGREGFTDVCFDAPDPELVYGENSRSGRDAEILREASGNGNGSDGHDWSEPWIEAAQRFCKLDDGLSTRLAGRNRVAKLKALGNAVVPQIVEIIGRAIMEIENA